MKRWASLGTSLIRFCRHMEKTPGAQFQAWASPWRTNRSAQTAVAQTQERPPAGGGPEADARMLEAVRPEIRVVGEHLPVLALKTMRGHLESGLDFWIGPHWRALGGGDWEGLGMTTAQAHSYGPPGSDPQCLRKSRGSRIRCGKGPSRRNAFRSVPSFPVVVFVVAGRMLAIMTGP